MIGFKKAARLLLFGFAALFCFTVHTAASAPSEEQLNHPDNDYLKVYIITEQDEQGVVLQQPERRVFWEYPLLSAGQTRTGKLYIKNVTGNRLDFSPSSINLPYGDKQALIYISKLRIKIEAAGELLYQGSYGNIAGRSGTNFTFPPLDPGETGEYTITLSCPFNFEGNPANETEAVEWKITAETDVGDNDSINEEVVLILSFCSFLVIAVIIITGYIRTGKTR